MSCPRRLFTAVSFQTRMSFLGATLSNIHIPSIGGIKKQISKVWEALYIYFEGSHLIHIPGRPTGERESFRGRTYKVRWELCSDGEDHWRLPGGWGEFCFLFMFLHTCNQSENLTIVKINLTVTFFIFRTRCLKKLGITCIQTQRWESSKSRTKGSPR